MKTLHLNLLLIIVLVLISLYLVFGISIFDENIYLKENMLNLNPAAIDYSLSDGISSDKWEQHRIESNNSVNIDIYKDLANIQAGEVPLPEGELNFFYANEFDSKCCLKPQQYSSSNGCACISQVQMKFLSERGGNNLSESNTN